MVPLVLVFASNFLATNALPAGAVQRLGSPQFRHGTEIVSSALSQDGKLLATAGTRTVIVWDVATGRRAHTFPASGISMLAFSPSGKRFAMTWAEQYRVWDTTSGRVEWTSWHSAASDFRCQFVDTDDVLAYGILAHPHEPGGELVRTTETRKIPSGELLGTRIGQTNWRETSGRFALRFDEKNGVATLLEWSSGREVKLPAQSVDEWFGFAASSNLQRVARRTRTGWLEVLSTASGSVVSIPLPDSLRGKAQGPAGPQQIIDYWAGTVGISDDGTEVCVRVNGELSYGIAPDAVRSVHRWDAATGKELPRLAGHDLGTVGVHFPSDGKTIVTTGCDGTIRVWDRATGRAVGPAPDAGGAAAFSSHGSTFATAGDGQLAVFDTQTGERQAYPLPRVPVSGLALSPTGLTAATGFRNGTIKLVETTTGRERPTPLPDPTVPQWSAWRRKLEFSPGGEHLAFMGNRGLIVWNATTGRARSESPGCGVSTITSDGQVLTFGNDAKTLVQINPITGHFTPKHSIASPDPKLPDLPWLGSVLTTSPDGKWIAAASPQGPVVVQELETGKLLHRLPVMPLVDSMEAMFGTNPDRPSALAFSADSKWIAVGTSTHAVEVWEVASGQRLLHFEGHDTAVRVVQFAPDGRTLWSAGNDGLAYRWDVLPRSRAPREWGQVWARLTKGEPSSVPATLREIVDDPSGAASFLRKMYQPPTRRDRERIAALIQELGDEEFAVREVAEEDIFSFGLAALAPLQAASRDPNPERSVRVARVLRRLAPEERAASLRAGRIATALELAGTPEARGLLAEWSKIAPDEYLGAEAKAATERLLRSSR